MFTGIVRHIGAVRGVAASAGGQRLTIDLGPIAEGLGAGDSVAVCGACLTAAQIRGKTGEFDVITETLAKTTLGKLRAGSPVNLERALKASDALDGHMVQGHVDGVGEVRSIRSDGEHVIEFAAHKDLTDQMVPKGSICIDGVSLTLATIADGRFSVALIPTTLGETTLGELRVGSKVNVETDVIGKYVLKYLTQMAGGNRGNSGGSLTADKLRQAGFFE